MPVRSLLAAFALFLSACSADRDAPEYDQLVLVRGATIVTMDPGQPVASQMLIGDGKIIAIGDNLPWKEFAADGDVHIVIASDRTILPGFIDSHVHVRELGMDAVKADLVGVETAEEMVWRIRAKFPDAKPGEWLVGQGWDEGAFASRGYPDRAALDAAFPDNPVALESLHGFAGFYNGKALEIAGITAGTPNPEAGTILKRENGSPTGVMLTLAQALVQQHVPSPSVQDREAAILAGLTIMAEAGVTSVHEAGMTPEDVAAVTNLAERGELPIRFYGMLDGNDEPLMQTWFERGPLDHPSGMLDIRGIKVFYDGSLGSRTAMLAEPYSDHPEKARMTERITIERIRSLADRAAKGGFQMAVHAIGDEGNRRTMQVYEDALAAHPDTDHRWRIEHAQVVLPDFYDRAARLGIVASMQPSHAVGDSGWAEDRVGSERIRHAYAWRTMLDRGVPIIFNSDLPGEPWTPMETLYFAVTRQKLDGTPADGWYADQALSVQESLEAMIPANARAAFQEAGIGMLKPGLHADFVVLDQNPLEIAPSTLKDIRVLETWVDGERLFEAGE